MRLMICGLMLVFLTACGKTEQSTTNVAPAVSDGPPAPVPAGFYPAATNAQVELSIVVPINPHEKPASPAAKQEAKAIAVELLTVMLNLENVVDDSSIMYDTSRYGRYFYRVMEEPLTRWQKLTDASHSDVFGHLGYCREAARALANLGDMVHAKNFALQFLDERRAQYKEALPKCQGAIANSK